jgi:uncharacterized protein (DUF2345 family)
MQVSPTGIILGGDLNTATPITAIISQAGIITDNPSGFDILSSLNMNSNAITNVDNISSTGGNIMNISSTSDFNINGDIINLTAPAGLNAYGNLSMNGYAITNVDNISCSAGGSLTITGEGGILMNSTNTGMNFTAAVDDIEFNCNGNSIYLNSNIDIGLTATNGIINLSAYDGISIGSITSGINLSTNGTEVSFTNCPLNMNSNDITNVDTISATALSDISITADGLIFLTSANDTINLTAPVGINILSPLNMNSNNITDVDNISSTIGSGISITGDANAYLTAGSNLYLSGEIISISNPNGFTNSINLNHITGDILIQSANGSVEITAGNGDAGNSGITLTSPEGNISLNPSLSNFVVTDSYIYAQLGGFNGPMYHSDQPTTAATYYLTFVQSAGISGYYIPNFDSATLTYNPSTNLLSVSGLQLSGATNTPTFSAGVLTCGCNESSSRQFQFGITANMTGLTLTNRRTNGVYTVSIYNVSGSTWTINHILTGVNKTNYNTAISIANGDYAILTARTLLTNGTAYNYVSVEKYS